MRKYFLVIFLFLCSTNLLAQYVSSHRNVSFCAMDTVSLDTLSIVPSSFGLFQEDGQPVDSVNYEVRYDKALLVILDKGLLGQELVALFRVFPMNFSKELRPYVIKNNSDSLIKTDDLWYMNESKTNTYKSESGIQANGNISRGITSGNGQNLVLNSNLNLQLSGKVDDKISIEAVLSDKNVPVQPNGYTQQINAFDQIYIRLYDSLRYLQMGDVDIQGTNSHFLRFQRRLQGGDFGGHYNLKGNKKVFSQASAAIAKGTFNRSEFLGIEGVQGPYPLLGVNNERFIVVLAGSERVFVDGQLLQRGEQSDYVINYNTAELIFTPRILITKDSRVIVEFEYSDRNYNRFLVFGQTEVRDNKTSVGIQFFSESDAKNQPVDQTLNDEHKRILSKAGDNPLNAIVPNVDRVAFDKNQVLYAMVDTLVDGILYDSIFKASYNSDSAFYQLGFAFVGQGKGNYQQVPSAANGKLYVWMAPINNVPQGGYEPIQLLVAPKKQQMYVINLAHEFGDNTGVNVETAISNRDLNTFSGLDADDNVGMAFKANAYQFFDVSRHRLKSYSHYEFIHQDFNEVERFRSAEFDRDWNIILPRTTEQHLITVGLGLLDKSKALGDINMQYLNQADEQEGLRFNLNLALDGQKNNAHIKQSYLTGKDVFRTTQFYRHKIHLNHAFDKLEAGVKHEMEDNVQHAINADSLLGNSMRYSLSEAYVQMADTLKRTVGINFRNRLDYLPHENKLTYANVVNDITLKAKLTQMKSNRFVLSATYRNLAIKNADIITTNLSEDNFLARLDHQLDMAKRAVSFSTFYEVGSGLETKQEFVYVEVAPGQGVYVWVDYNQNGIPELDEFEISKFQEEANYIRIYTPSNDYIKAFSLKFNHTFKLNPANVWRNETGIKQFVSRFSNNLSLRLSNKQTQESFSARLNPFYSQFSDSTLLNNRTGVRNTFSFNRSDPKFGADWIFSFNTSKNLMVNGFDQAQFKNNQLKLRWNITRNYFLRNNISYGVKEFESEFFSSRNYQISGFENGTTFQWQPNPKFRFSLFYTYYKKENLWGDESSAIHEAGPEFKYNRAGKGTLTAKLSTVQVNYNGVESSSVAYEMLNAFLPGQNYTWNVNWSQNLSQYLRLSVVYSGRTAADSDVIHLGQVNLSAFF